jgi:hypothetical protein
MSRSFKHKPYSGATTARSERIDKKIWHRRFRTIQRSLLSNPLADRESLVMPVVREVSDPWQMSKDGKYYWPDEFEPTLSRRPSRRTAWLLRRVIDR